MLHGVLVTVLYSEHTSNKRPLSAVIGFVTGMVAAMVFEDQQFTKLRVSEGELCVMTRMLPPAVSACDWQTERCGVSVKLNSYGRLITISPPTGFISYEELCDL